MDWKAGERIKWRKTTTAIANLTGKILNYNTDVDQNCKSSGEDEEQKKI
jgi:hypothetical protein